MKSTIKIVIAILLLLCLADMPYGYYQLVRFVAMAGFAFLAYDSLKTGQKVKGVIFVLLAALFQPFFKIALGRTLWNAVDVIVAIGLFYLIITSFNKKKG